MPGVETIDLLVTLTLAEEANLLEEALKHYEEGFSLLQKDNVVSSDESKKMLVVSVVTQLSFYHQEPRVRTLFEQAQALAGRLGMESEKGQLLLLLEPLE